MEVDCNVLVLRMLVLFGAREDGCCREVAALYSDSYRQVPPHRYCTNRYACLCVCNVCGCLCT